VIRDILFILVVTGKVIVASITIQDAHSEQRLNASYFKIYLDHAGDGLYSHSCPFIGSNE